MVEMIVIAQRIACDDQGRAMRFGAVLEGRSENSAKHAEGVPDGHEFAEDCGD